MGAMEDTFGHIPGRPDHPDFWKLSSAVLSMDADIEDGRAFDEVVAVDVMSLVYVAEQRWARAVERLDGQVQPSLLWIDGFEAGRRFERESRDK